MDEEKKLRVLLDLAESLGIEVRRVGGCGAGWDSPGGSLVRLRHREILFLDPAASIGAQVAAAASALARRSEIEQIFLPPEIRETIDRIGGQA